ncbi:CYTH domain-containing protein [Lactobacillus hamsteri]|uniref:Adenylate cyclase n=1 Tax=Lactobacillus hamsteri DSM 5661 = JCM 6256 TaxID=1423754 RepID=A0A0R1YME8_9LACO|nr:CYTH domain-containing protein [Lactobacillus hamsteri]KRM41147.1 adenylate cyclase [Lactobacillus hamsteri DSM 5661 = JCM 6256]
MSKNREIEAKTILSKEVYQKLIAAFPVKSDFIQENYYFDTPDWVLKDHNIGLRIRIYSDHAEQTMKVPDTRPLQKKFHEVIEINDDLSLDDAKNFVDQAKNNQKFVFSGNIGSYLDKHFKDEKTKLNLFTWSKTRRILANGPENCELTLDDTQYPDGYEDYELEIENTDPELIKKVQLQLEKDFLFTQTKENTNQNKIARALAHRK